MGVNYFERIKKIRKSIAWWGCLCVITGLLVYINSHFITVAIVNGDSMLPSMRDGELLFVDRIHNIPSRGDVILIQVNPNKFGSKYIVKRVIATSGELVTIDYDKNEVRINGKLLSEPYINWHQDDSMKAIYGNNKAEYNVPDGCLFVLGDNRNYSADSRSAEIGFIQKIHVIGKVTNP